MDVHGYCPGLAVTDNLFFYIPLTCMIMGTMLFLSGYMGELISRNGAERNAYLIEKRIGLEMEEGVLKN